MQFVYHPKSGELVLVVEGETYNYIFKVRRHKKGEVIPFRNLKDQYLYYYLIEEVDRRRATLSLKDKELREVMPKREFHLLWCIIDPKSIEKSLPALNELGVAKITFIYCQRSQKNFRLKLEKLQKILINSSQQCGRSRLMELEIKEDIKSALALYPDTVLIDFCEDRIGCGEDIKRALIGPEGGVSPQERAEFGKILGFDTPLVLKSETAAIAVASKVII